MSAQALSVLLRRLDYGGSIAPADLEWLFSSGEAAATFLTWVCEAVGPENKLTSEELLRSAAAAKRIMAPVPLHAPPLCACVTAAKVVQAVERSMLLVQALERSMLLHQRPASCTLLCPSCRGKCARWQWWHRQRWWRGDLMVLRWWTGPTYSHYASCRFAQLQSTSAASIVSGTALEKDLTLLHTAEPEGLIRLQ